MLTWGYSEYSQGVLGVLKGVCPQLRIRAAWGTPSVRRGTLSAHMGTPSTHRGYSECSQVYSECSHGYSEYSQGVLKGVSPQLRVRAARGKPSLSPADGAGPTPLTAPPRVRTRVHALPLGLARARVRRGYSEHSQAVL